MTSTDTAGQILPFESRNPQLAALDLGSNSFHLLIAQESHGRIQILDKHKEMVRLAEGLNDDNTLDPLIARRALDCLERFAQRLRSLEPGNVRIVGTNTLRKAQATADFVGAAEQILGHSIDIISGREEARLIYLGVCHDLGGDDTRRLVVDIGGGSTEMILGRRTTPQTLESLYMGCVSMSRNHFAKGKLSKAAMNRAINAAKVELEPVVRGFANQGWDSVVGASGTINAVSEVGNQLGYGHTVTPDSLGEIRRRIVQAKTIDNLHLEGLAEERRAVFPGGVAILSAIVDYLGIEQMAAAQSALREGVIYDLLGRKHEDDMRDHTVISLMQRYRIDEAQARHVRETAIALFSQVAGVWQLTRPHHKLLLSWASSLHEIGMDVSHAGYHKHGGYLLENLDMPGFSRLDQAQLSLLVRTHRRRISADVFGGAPSGLRELAVLLRIAVVLHRNRGHEALPHIEARAEKQDLTITLPKDWRRAHPLTLEDLKTEAGYLGTIGVTLKIAQ